MADIVVQIDHLEQLIATGQYDQAWLSYTQIADQITDLSYAHRCEVEALRTELERKEALCETRNLVPLFRQLTNSRNFAS